MLPLGAVDGRDRQLRAHVLQREVLGHQLGRIELDADGGLLLAADGDLADAGNLADLLRELGIGVVVHLGQGQGVGGDRQQQDRRVGRVDLAIGRRRRQIARQLAAGGIDGGLDVVGRRIDVAIEIELHDDRGGAEPAGGRRLRHARDLRELPLQRLRDRRGHGLGAGARQLRGHLNGREVDLRQRRDRQARIGDQARRTGCPP